MPLFCFQCLNKKCRKPFESIERFDPSGKYPSLACPYCEGKKKEQLISMPHILGPTSSKMENFSYRAGHNLENAKNCRRKAEVLSHMGTDPYTPIDDTPMDTGIHDNDLPIRL